MSGSARLAALLALLGALATPVGAHEVRPGYLQLEERDTGVWEILFKIPARGERRLSLRVRLPEHCRVSEISGRAVVGAHVERSRATCSGELVGERVTIDGLAETRTDVLARVTRRDGGSASLRLTPDEPGFVVPGRSAWTDVAATYLGLGAEHILLGIDHLLFVVALLLLVHGPAMLVGTVTAFTLAHSVTLVAATLGWLHVAQPPVEATIALSIVFVAVEIVRGTTGQPGLAARRPWIVALAFGLLHGLGFAGALREVGLPEDAIPVALAFFNVGVELGQLAFVGAVLSLLGLAAVATRGLGLPAEGSTRSSSGRDNAGSITRRIARPAGYAIGIVASFWLIERTLRFWA